jgi:hypothetical protein
MTYLKKTLSVALYHKPTVKWPGIERGVGGQKRTARKNMLYVVYNA